MPFFRAFLRCILQASLFLFSSYAVGGIHEPGGVAASISVDAWDGAAKNINIVWARIQQDQLDSRLREASNSDESHKTEQSVPILVVVDTEQAESEEARLVEKALEKNGLRYGILNIDNATDERILDSVQAVEEKPRKNNFLSGLRKYFVEPTRSELAIGAITLPYKPLLSAVVFLSVGVHPSLVAGIVTGFLIQQTPNLVMRSVDNLFAGGTERRSSYFQSTIEFGKRQIIGLSILEFVRLLTGPIGNAPSALTLHGQLDLFQMQLIWGSVGSIVHSIRNQKLSREASNWVKVYMSMFAIPLGLMDLAGVHMVGNNMDLGLISLTDNQVLYTSIFALIGIGIHVKTNMIERFAKSHDYLLDRAYEIARASIEPLKKSCHGLANLFARGR